MLLLSFVVYPLSHCLVPPKLRQSNLFDPQIFLLSSRQPSFLNITSPTYEFDFLPAADFGALIFGEPPVVLSLLDPGIDKTRYQMIAPCSLTVSIPFPQLCRSGCVLLLAQQSRAPLGAAAVTFSSSFLEIGELKAGRLGYCTIITTT